MSKPLPREIRTAIERTRFVHWWEWDSPTYITVWTSLGTSAWYYIDGKWDHH